MPDIVTIRKAAAVKEIQEHPAVCRIYLITVPSMLQIVIHIFAVNTHNTGSVTRTLHASLDF